MRAESNGTRPPVYQIFSTDRYLFTLSSDGKILRRYEFNPATGEVLKEKTKFYYDEKNPNTKAMAWRKKIKENGSRRSIKEFYSFRLASGICGYILLLPRKDHILRRVFSNSCYYKNGW